MKVLEQAAAKKPSLPAEHSLAMEVLAWLC